MSADPNLPLPSSGDRVRVVLEGDVGVVFNDGFSLCADDRMKFRHIYSASPLVVSVEILTRPLKVGDTIERERYDDVPHGTLVRAPHTGIYILRRMRGDWITSTGEKFAGNPGFRATVVYLPEATS